MLIPATIYLTMSIAMLAVLTAMLLRIGGMLSDCPQTGPVAKAGAMTVATGFAACGIGGVVLIASGFAGLSDGGIESILLAMGFAALLLGLGFTHAVATLRAVIRGVAVEPT